ncbi:hypothetical protein LCGC14_1507960 [marine sediment metagenome]|uniref:Uncharacterized protein n=1 Tax=marine sediment metagenome TaxID=412755 RepID=A0A0F9M3K8_9ZZZZ
MIRFINLTGQILIDDPEVNFAWFDTIISQFKTFNDSQEWHSWNDFVDDLTEYLKRSHASQDESVIVLERFKRLYPPTVLFMEGYKEPEEPKNHPTTTKVTKTADFVKGISSTTVTDEFYGKKKT